MATELSVVALAPLPIAVEDTPAAALPKPIAIDFGTAGLWRRKGSAEEGAASSDRYTVVPGRRAADAARRAAGAARRAEGAARRADGSARRAEVAASYGKGACRRGTKGASRPGLAADELRGSGRRSKRQDKHGERRGSAGARISSDGTSHPRLHEAFALSAPNADRS